MLGRIRWNRIALQVLVVLVLAVSPLLAESRAGECRDFGAIFAGTTWRVPGGAPGESWCFAVETPTAGLTLVEVSTPGTVDSTLLLGPAERATPPADGSKGGAASARWSPAGPMTWPIGWLASWSGGPTSHPLRLVSLDPGRALEPSKVTVMHLDWRDAASTLVSRVEEAPGENEDELEIEPKRGDVAGRYTGPMRPRPALGALRALLRATCDGTLEDDHADTFACATRLDTGRSIEGEIRNGWGDDEDVFTFTLEQSHGLRIEVAGAVELDIQLYDSSGHRLALEPGVGEPPAERYVLLAAGSYSLRLAGTHGREGPYRLRLDTDVW